MAGGVTGTVPPSVTHVGVDGCPAGWIAAGVGDGEWFFAVCDEFAVLLDQFDAGEPELILVDVPIGLREENLRECDELAREVLGSRWNSVFRTPVEPAVELKRREEEADRDYRPDASTVNDERTGYGLSAQVWNITDKIAELDDVVRTNDLPLDGTIREAHPELAFMAYNGQPIAYSKTSRRGAELRKRALNEEGVNTDDLLGRSRRTLEGEDVGADDVLDAIALARAAGGELTSVPVDPAPDQPRIYYPDRAPAWDDQSYFSG